PADDRAQHPGYGVADALFGKTERLRIGIQPPPLPNSLHDRAISVIDLEGSARVAEFGEVGLNQCQDTSLVPGEARKAQTNSATDRAACAIRAHNPLTAQLAGPLAGIECQVHARLVLCQTCHPRALNV